MSQRIILTGGGTGGHIFPLIAVAEELKNEARQKGIDLGLELLGDGQIFLELARQSGLVFHRVISPKWRRYLSFRNFTDLLKLPLGFLQALFYVWRFMPDIIFAKGGYASLLPSLIAKLMFIPLVIHETDAVPGATNVFLSRFSRKIFIAMENAKGYFNESKIELVGNPLRSGILSGGGKAAALDAFSLKPDKPTVLITGASQGAQKINEILVLALVELAKNFQIIHQTGQKNFDEVNKIVSAIVKEAQNSYGQAILDNYRAYPFLGLREMSLAYAACDVIVSRSGGSQIFEAAAVAKPTILIPLASSSRNHQLANAQEAAKFGAVVIEEANLTAHILINEITKAYANRESLSTKIKQFAKPEAAKTVAQNLLDMII